MKKPLNNTAQLYYAYKNRKLIIPMLKDTLSGNFRLSVFSLFVLVLTLLYTLFPLDILPDFIPFIGWVDDGILMYLLFLQLKKETKRYSLFKIKKEEQLTLIKS